MKQINISEESYEKIKDPLLAGEKLEVKNFDDFVGRKLFIRTVTYHFVGKLDKIIGSFFIMSNVSWIADSGRFSNCIKTGSTEEVEPIGDWNVNFNTITDFGIWNHTLNIDQK